jgi:hypothetical protein
MRLLTDERGSLVLVRHLVLLTENCSRRKRSTMHPRGNIPILGLRGYLRKNGHPLRWRDMPSLSEWVPEHLLLRIHVILLILNHFRPYITVLLMKVILVMSL